MEIVNFLLWQIRIDQLLFCFDNNVALLWTTFNAYKVTVSCEHEVNKSLFNNLEKNLFDIKENNLSYLERKEVQKNIKHDTLKC